MKGIIFNLLADLVRREHGDDVWDRILDGAGVDGVYTSLGNYPDAELGKLVMAASTLTGQSADDVTRWFGRGALHMLAQKYPALFLPHRDTRSFLLTLNDVIHPEVRKLYPGVDVPIFDYDTSSPDVLVMGYRSSRKLCLFGEGLIEGAAEHFKERVALTQPQCARRGDPKCVYRMSFTRP